jgi:hypothetical protein
MIHELIMMVLALVFVFTVITFSDLLLPTRRKTYWVRGVLKRDENKECFVINDLVIQNTTLQWDKNKKCFVIKDRTKPMLRLG